MRRILLAGLSVFTFCAVRVPVDELVPRSGFVERLGGACRGCLHGARAKYLAGKKENRKSGQSRAFFSWISGRFYFKQRALVAVGCNTNTRWSWNL